MKKLLLLLILPIFLFGCVDEEYGEPIDIVDSEWHYYDENTGFEMHISFYYNVAYIDTFYDDGWETLIYYYDYNHPKIYFTHKNGTAESYEAYIDIDQYLILKTRYGNLPFVFEGYNSDWRRRISTSG